MPVHAEITSLTMWLSTQTRSQGIVSLQCSQFGIEFVEFRAHGRRIPGAFFQSAAEFTNFPNQRGFRYEALFKFGEPGRDLGAFQFDLFQSFDVIATGGCFPREHTFL